MKQPKPWYRAQTRSWYVTLNGAQHRLGEHPTMAAPPRRLQSGWNAPQSILDIFYKLMTRDVLTPPAEITVASIADRFLEHIQKKHDARTYKWYRGYLQDFCNRFGRLRAAELKPFHVNEWLDDHPRWKASRRHAVVALKRVFNWADRQGLFSPSPIRFLERPPAGRRNAMLTRKERREILAAIPDIEFRQFVESLQETGARPSEIARLTAAEVNLSAGICVLNRHKTAGKTGKPRVVYMTPRFESIVRKLMKKHPTGPLFRGPRFGRPFGMHGITARFRRLREKLPHIKNAMACAYRASFATDALMNGVGVAQVAELLGHRDLGMIEKHYSFIHTQTDYMRSMAQRRSGHDELLE